MEGEMTNGLSKNERISGAPEVLDSFWVSDSPSPSFLGSTTMLNFEDIQGKNNIEKPFLSKIDNKSDNSNEDFDECFRHQEKKRRLLPEQVQFLEKSFELENKLEPERKVKLAEELGLQPRQVAIWFQNRRARYKTKQLEKEYDSLKASFDLLKEDYDALYKENERLKIEVQFLEEKLPKMEPFDPTSPLDLQPTKKPIIAPNAATVMACKQEDASSSARSDVFDSDSPRYTDSVLVAELTDSSHATEPYASDEDDNIRRRLLPSSSFLPKLELQSYDDLQPNSCNLGFPVQDQGTWLWQC
ncbi:homeobox-leucine zipper protein HAT5-like [Primulina huaijiensis]|uniref:homeobox-leucine zipper protein HAT5-like n=1 Tax=Primulina huaijiensis TaxID=1492673 RepID=UPI003CC71570